MRRNLWFTEEQLQSVSHVIANTLDQRYSPTLQDIHNELAVAQQRAQTSNVPVDLLNKVLGRKESYIPVKLSVDELVSLIELPFEDNIREIVLKAL